jgi:hypothetical protein
MLVNVSFSVEGCIRGDMEMFDDSMLEYLLVFNILGGDLENRSVSHV